MARTDAIDALFARLLGSESLQRSLSHASEPGAIADALCATGVPPAEADRFLAELVAQSQSPPVRFEAEAPPRQWLPVQIYRDGERFLVEWLHFGFAPLVEPFFEQSVAIARALPINLVARCCTPLAALDALAAEPQPDGLVFHVSRCGSTLVGQVLAALGNTVVVSEAPPLDAAIRLWLDGHIPGQTVRGIAGALARDRGEGARHRVFKLDSWHTLAFDRVVSLFPLARTALLFRDPLEVLVSQRGRPGLHVLRGGVPLASFGLGGSHAVADEDYAAWVIAAIFRKGTDAARRGMVVPVDYADLPAAIEKRLMPHFGIAADKDARVRVHEAEQRYSKDPSRAFVPDGTMKQEAADARLRNLAQKYGLPQIFADLRRMVEGKPTVRVSFNFASR